MKASKLTFLLAIAVALTFVAGGCKKKPVGITDIPGRKPGYVGDPNLNTTGLRNPNEDLRDVTGATPIPDLGDWEHTYNQDPKALEADMVHFDYDSAAIRGSERPHIEAVASFMKSAPANVALLVEGHCDERGTEEYNRSLGERRALAAREALIASGADGMKIVTKSYGKDRKIDFGNSEASHAKNRRAAFVVLTPK